MASYKQQNVFPYAVINSESVISPCYGIEKKNNATIFMCFIFNVKRVLFPLKKCK